jgi:3-methyladenine DNA glycosylase/8-oxoguanine DNA glycosylase
LKEKSETIAFGLKSPEIKALCASDKRLALLIRHYGELKYSLYTEPFSFFVKTIIGQMLSNKAAGAITARLYTICSDKLTAAAILQLDMVDT